MDNAIQQSLSEGVRTLASDTDSITQLKSFCRWRARLISTLEKQGGTIGRQAPQWPARPDLPCFTIWQRLSLAAALAGAGTDRVFLSFRFAGIQEFIDRARTTADYWSSSQLLSYLSWQAAQVIAEQLGPDSLIFPQPWALSGYRRWCGIEAAQAGGDCPSGFLAIVPRESARAVANSSEKAIHIAWSELTGKCFAVMNSLRPPRCVKSEWNAQLDPNRVFEIYWATVSCNTGDYGERFQAISTELETRKMLRNFEAWEQPGLKCYQDGYRQALPGGAIGAAELRKWWDDLSQHKSAWVDGKSVNIENRFRAGERLSGLAVVKRLASRLIFEDQAESKISFPSTASVAVVPFLESLSRKAANPRVATAVSAFLSKLILLLQRLGSAPLLHISPYPEYLANAWKQVDLPDVARVDGSWWYDSEFNLESIRREYGTVASAQGIPDLTSKCAELLLAVRKEAELDPPSRYVALLAGDMDDIGGWIRGARAAPLSSYAHSQFAATLGVDQRTPDFYQHLALGEALTAAAAVADVEVTKLGGRLVYAGGDDYLAFCPADRPLRVMDSIAQGVEVASGWLTEGRRGDRRLTISQAALLVPFNEPLSGAVAEAVRLLHETAKEECGRAAGAVSIRRRSGQQTIASGAWVTSDGRRVWPAIDSIAHLFRSGYVSPRGVAKAQEMAAGMRQINDTAGLQAMFLFLFGGKARPELSAALSTLLCAAQEAVLRGGNTGIWQQVEAQLLLARFLARQAQGEVL
ncbi:type III-B CRISPR-associated protein Cas10/Cmr2 [Paludibaculum fermentans]|uniref:type III-B CRISPR-associated protein Cas10/Cmr2 n=1 Tax=Paludibaculum fermentans TaxID=1473598 RepID=UPI003EBB07B2